MKIPFNVKNVSDAHFKFADLYLRALDLAIRHDLRPSAGEWVNETTLTARRIAALEILKEALAVEIMPSG